MVFQQTKKTSSRGTMSNMVVFIFIVHKMYNSLFGDHVRDEI